VDGLHFGESLRRTFGEWPRISLCIGQRTTHCVSLGLHDRLVEPLSKLLRRRG
jgi:hypothetical protein